MIATPLQEKCTESAHFVIFIESTFAHDFSPTTIFNIFKDALYIHTFQLRKILENDLEHQYAILVYRRNINSLYANKELLMKYTAAVPDHTSIGVFYEKKDDIINILKQRCYSDEYIGQLNIQTDITWGDLKVLYSLRHNEHRRDTHIHQYWALEGCPPYYLYDQLFDTDEEVNDMRASIKQSNFFYMIGVSKKYNKTLYNNYNDEVILKFYSNVTIVDLHQIAKCLFPHTSALPFEFVINYNERHVSEKLDGYLGQPIIICYVDDLYDYEQSAYPEDMHSYWKFQKLSKIIHRDDIYHNVEVFIINYNENITPEMRKGFNEQLMKRYTSTT